MIRKKTLINLEFDKMLKKISEYLSSDLAKSKLEQLTPAKSYDFALLSLNKTAEADKILYDFLINPNFAFDDVEEALNSAMKYSVLTQGELIKIGKLLKVSRKARLSIDSVTSDEIFLLKEDASFLFENATLEEHILTWIINETEIADFASDKLYSLRKQIRKTNDLIKKRMQEYVQSNKYQKYLQESLITVRGDRYVIPVKAEYKTSIPGLIHDQSSSGATVFIEPFPIVELNNELKTLIIEERLEVERILADLSESVGGCAEKLANNCEILSDLDLIFAKAIYSHENNCTFPKLNTNGLIDIKEGRHPLIEKEKVVPVSVKVGDKYSILLITGPNTGGKTVTLKLTGLLTLMAMSGIFIPAKDESEIAFFEDVFTDIGDEQSIQQNLSTFSAHIKNIAEITNNLSKNSLVLLDELGAGTDPAEGAGIAVAVTEEILNSGAKAIITTHYSEMKAFSFACEGVENASMEFNPANYAPTYRLNIGIPGASNALKIAERLGLGERIIKSAYSHISNERINFENVLLDAERERIKAREEVESINAIKNEILEKYSNLEQEISKFEAEKQKFYENTEKKAKKIIDNYVEEAQEIIDQLKQARAKNNDKGFFEATKLNGKLIDLKYKKAHEKKEKREFVDSKICEGDIVFVERLNSEAEVLTLKANGKCVLKLGNMEMNSNISELKKVKPTRIFKNEEKNKITVSKAFSAETVKTEINVIGQNREECIENVAYFLDKCILAGVEQAKIIHGTGSGILKKAVSEFLRTKKEVKSFRAGRYGEGENGVTIVELN